jgi:hypothetical protein
MLGAGYPKAVLGLDGSLPLDIFAPERFVRGKPGGGVFVAFSAVGGAVGCHEVQGVIGELLALIRAQLLGTFLPGIAKRDDMVNLDF